jgi:hypothetical protein
MLPRGPNPEYIKENIEKWLPHSFFNFREGIMYIEAQRFIEDKRYVEGLLLSSTCFELFLKNLCYSHLVNKGIDKDESKNKLRKVKQETLLQSCLKEAIGKSYSEINPSRFEDFKRRSGARDIRNKVFHGDILSLKQGLIAEAGNIYLELIDDLMPWYNMSEIFDIHSY